MRIDGRAVAAEVRARIRRQVADLDLTPGLATVLVGDDPASHIYVGSKRKACAEAGMESFHHELGADASQDEVAELIGTLNADPRVHGILLQLPVPEGLDGSALTALIDPRKDVDGLTPVNAGLLVQGRDAMVPCTPNGVMVLLDHVDTPLEGADAVILGRSDLVGRPLVSLLLHRNATVTVCHSRTRGLAEVCSRADVLIAAVGRPGLVTAEMVKEGATVIDVGINRVDGKLVGDVDFDSVEPKARAITPVPGGVGPMTIAMLLDNTLSAARSLGVAR
ncbi:MAG TPA: bifunctional methylenetetrahydrofolate dehydrogenase/methenyltetrahydrofolate cyclohydrolase FolD [Thermoleophilaceae bacterium]|nr:bifunctional methylenetetrahydrofolate dehydrogenase/methenyltetrahydrofolate cyclohydrolase FolD [Thermoleophilaceae bacterium]